MPVNWYAELYSLAQSEYGRPITVNPVASQPGVPAYSARGIYNSDRQQYLLEDDSLLTEQQTIIDVEASEFAVPPAQNDIITIPAEPISGLLALGDFQVTASVHNGAGEITLQLKKVVP
jgi:hypothetical protein